MTVNFDFVVVGSGPCSFAFVERTFKNRPDARILVLEMGGVDAVDQKFQWKLKSEETKNSKLFLHGLHQNFGGQSRQWTGWCPRPSREELPGWPKQVIDACQEYFEGAEDLLDVIPVDDECMRPLFGKLHSQAYEHLGKKMMNIPSIYRHIAAPISIDRRSDISWQPVSVSKKFTKLLSKKTRDEEGELRIDLHCQVQSINHEEGRAISIDTSKGRLHLEDKSKVILAMGTIPTTTLLANSFPHLRNVIGKRFGGHFMSRMMVRIPVHKLPWTSGLDEEIEFAAVYMAGSDNNDMRSQYHLQLSAMHGRSEEATPKFFPAHKLGRHFNFDNLDNDGHVVFYCSGIGELDVDNRRNFMRIDPSVEEKTSNMELALSLNENDLRVWTAIDNIMFHIFENILTVCFMWSLSNSIDELSGHTVIHSSWKIWKSEV